MSILQHDRTQTTPITEIDAPASEWPATEEIDGFTWELSPEFRTIEEHEQDETAEDHLWNAQEPSETDWADYHAWAAAFEPEPTLSLLELVVSRRDHYRGWNTDAGTMIADHLEELARLLEVTGAATPAEHDARIDALDRDYV